MRSSVESGADSRFKFQGKEYDTELSLNLYYFEARFYRPDIGRFALPDPSRQGWSYYAFCANNPLRFVDPTGLDEFDFSAPIKRDGMGGLSTLDSRACMKTPFLDASNRVLDWGVVYQDVRGTIFAEESRRIWNDGFGYMNGEPMNGAEREYVLELLANIGYVLGRTNITFDTAALQYFQDAAYSSRCLFYRFTSEFTNNNPTIMGAWGFQMPNPVTDAQGRRIPPWGDQPFDLDHLALLINTSIPDAFWAFYYLHESVHIHGALYDYDNRDWPNLWGDDRANELASSGIGALLWAGFGQYLIPPWQRGG